MKAPKTGYAANPPNSNVFHTNSAVYRKGVNHVSHFLGVFFAQILRRLQPHTVRQLRQYLPERCRVASYLRITRDELQKSQAWSNLSSHSLDYCLKKHSAGFCMALWRRVTSR